MGALGTRRTQQLKLRRGWCSGKASRGSDSPVAEMKTMSSQVMRLGLECSRKREETMRRTGSAGVRGCKVERLSVSLELREGASEGKKWEPSYTNGSRGGTLPQLDLSRGHRIPFVHYLPRSTLCPIRTHFRFRFPDEHASLFLTGLTQTHSAFFRVSSWCHTALVPGLSSHILSRKRQPFMCLRPHPG